MKSCHIKTITVAGIHAYIIDEDGNIPITAFVSIESFIDSNNASFEFSIIINQTSTVYILFL